MGYTHYWTFKPCPKGKAAETEKAYQLAIRQCNRVIRSYNNSLEKGDYRRLSGFSAHTKSGTYGGLQVNGCGSQSHEDFTMREHYKQNLGQDCFGNSFNFCKTARKPYDVVVTACLIILKHYLKDLFTVSTDGYVEDWLKGKILADMTLRMRFYIPLIEKKPNIPLINPDTMYTR